MERLKRYDEKNFAQSKMSGLITTGIAALTSFCASTALADDLSTAVTKIANNFKGFLVSIANPIAIIVLGICFFTLFLSRNPQKKEISYDWLKGIILAFIGINLITLIVGTAQNMLKGIDGTDTAISALMGYLF